MMESPEHLYCLQVKYDYDYCCLLLLLWGKEKNCFNAGNRHPLVKTFLAPRVLEIFVILD